MAANYYGFGTGASSQQYSVGTPGSYSSPTYRVQASPHGQFVSSQPVQQQQAYVTYGVRSAGSAPSQSYQSSYTYGSTPHASPQQATFNKPATQSQQYYQASTTSTAWGSSSKKLTMPQTNYMAVKPAQPQHPRPSLYASNNASSYSQQQQPTVQQINATSAATHVVQGSSSINYGASKSAAPTVHSSKGAYGQDHRASISNYEKALISAANSIYAQQRKDGGGPENFPKNMPYWKQKRLQVQANRDPNKPIIASEVKAYLYAWLGKFRARPEYNISAHGTAPYRQTYVCEVVVSGYPYVGKGTASNKKDSQTRAAWDFCDYLVREGKMTESELPTRESKFQPSQNKLPSSYKNRTDSDLIASNTKQKVVSNKINFVGGTTLHLNDVAMKEVKIEKPVAYPTLVTQPTVVTEAQKPIEHKIVPKLPTVLKPVVTLQAHSDSDADAVDPASLKNGPIGEEYVDQVWTDGRVVRFRCKICECEFNDVSARELHVKGRRHRLSYKRKIDPSIEVDVKLNPKQKQLMMMKMRQEARKEAIREQHKKQEKWKMEMRKIEQEERRLYEEEMFYHYQNELIKYEEQAEIFRRRGAPMPLSLVPPAPPRLTVFKPTSVARFQQMKTRDDQHVLAKHAQIYPSEDELKAVQNAVQVLEVALKEVSNTVHEQEMKVFTASNNSGKKIQPERLLKAVLRIGALAQGLLLRDDLVVELVLMCNQKPTISLVNRVAEHLPKHLTAASADEKFTMKIAIEDCAIVLATSSQPVVTVRVILTATQMRSTEIAEAGATKTDSKPDPPDILDREKCCIALAALRHSKWFQANASGLQSCVIVTRIMKDLCVRVPTWSPISSWAVELLVERVIASATLPLSPSGALQRVFEALASGVLLPGGPGILDPCERGPTDAAEALSSQEREDITASAQHALRLIAFRNIHKVLGIDPLPVKSSKKRINADVDDSNGASQQVKKGKIE